MSKRPQSKRPRTRTAPTAYRTFSLEHFGLTETDETDTGSTSTSTTLNVGTRSQDTRRIINTTVAGPSLSPVKQTTRAPIRDTELSSSTPDDLSNFTFAFARHFVVGGGTSKPKHTRLKKVRLPRRKKYASSDFPMQTWMRSRDEVLAEMMRTRGRGSFEDRPCPSCPAGGSPASTPLYRCRECFSKKLLCRSCCVKAHLENPFHSIQQWTGKFFRRCSLFSLGLCVQMGHEDSSPCSVPQFSKVTIISNSGIHRVRIAFCGCSAGASDLPWQQAMRREWYPATLHTPRTFATFSVLNTFHKMTLEGKSTTYDFYSALEKLTDNTGKDRGDRYKDFLRVMRQWRHLKMLMRAGRGNDGVRNIAQTEQGELALRCPACPHPGINLPDNWNSPDTPNPFVYTQFLAIDACFRLKRKLVGSIEKDPYLQPGMGYLVDPEPYREYLKSVTDQDEMCTCTGLAALDFANTKYSKGYAQTGIAMCCCARHEMIGPNSAGALQKGERYANIDYVVASFLKHVHPLLRLLLSYDIICQWFKKCVERLKKLPPNVRLDLVHRIIKYVIPKLHIYGHKLACQLKFLLNLTLGVGRTDAEGIERTWANMGPVATSTKEMGPGSCADTLEDHWGHWNWEKIVGLGKLLRRRLTNALQEQAEQEASFAKFSQAQFADLGSWKKMVDDFENDPTQPNPYELPKSGFGLQEIRAQIAEEDLRAAQQERGTVEDSDDDSEPLVVGKSLSGAEFLMTGLEIEEHQRQLKLDLAGVRDPTPQQTASFTETRNRLMGKINRFRKLQATHSPSALQAYAVHPSVLTAETPLNPEHIPLILPSEQPLVPQLASLRDLEGRLRDGQCQDALDQLRNDLLVKSRLHTYKKSSARHQGATTRARGVLDRHERKIKLSTARYQQAWNAKLAIVGGDKGKVGWHVLEQADVRTMYDLEDQEKRNKKKLQGRKRRRRNSQSSDSDSETGSESDDNPAEPEGYRLVSWIWMGADNTDLATDGLLHQGLRVEWSKAYARVRRWREEVLILNEEMRRTLEYMEWKGSWWEERSQVTEFTGAHYAGVSAYAHEQAETWRSIGQRFAALWERNGDNTFKIQFKKKGGGGRRAIEESLFDAREWQLLQRPTAEVNTAFEPEPQQQEDSDASEYDAEDEEEEELEEVWEEVEDEPEVEQGVPEQQAEVQEDPLDLDLDVLAISGKYAPSMDF